MTDITAPVPAATEAHKGLAARVFGVVVSPRATFADVVARPRSLGVLALCMFVVIGGVFALLSTDVGREATLDQQVRMLESFGVRLNEAQQAQMEARVDNARYYAAASQLVGIPVVALILSGLLLGVFNAILGGDATFKQVFAVVAHTGVITALATAFALPLDYVNETMSSPTNLGVFVSFLDEASFLSRLLGSIDLFQIWALVTLSIGLGVLYKRRTVPVATGMLVVYGVIVLAVAAVRSALSS
jgi:hypothetical protein